MPSAFYGRVARAGGSSQHRPHAAFHVAVQHCLSKRNPRGSTWATPFCGKTNAVRLANDAANCRKRSSNVGHAARQPHMKLQPDRAHLVTLRRTGVDAVLEV